MNNLQIYLHGESNRDPKMVEIPENGFLQDIIKKYFQEFSEVGHEEEINLFIEDAEEFIGNKKGNIEMQGIKKRCHVHCHRCTKIAVAVDYNGEVKSMFFPPSTTSKKILKKTLKEFEINESYAGDFLLKLKDGTILQPTDHIGSFASHPECRVKLFLTPTKPVQG